MAKVSIKIRMILSNIVISLIVVILISGLTYTVTSRVMTNKVGVLATAINDQMSLNIDNFLEDVEDVCNLAFADNVTRKYSSATSDLNEYDKLQIESDISNRLLNNSLLRNFGDFGIVYSNNEKVGRFAANTNSTLGADDFYKVLESKICNEDSEDGWFTNVAGSYKRIYYVKRINSDAILITSTYTLEMGTVLELSNQLEEMEVKIVTEDNVVLYSSSADDVGTEIEKNISAKYVEKPHSTFVENGYLYSTNVCGEKWFIITQIPTKIVLKELREIKTVTILVAVLSVILAIVMGVFFSYSIIKPIKLLMRDMHKAAKGDFTTRSEFVAGGEVGNLVSSFNQMMEEIQGLLLQVDSIIDLVIKNSEIIRKVSTDSAEISRNITIAMEGIAEGAQEQLAETQNTFSSLESLANSINKTVENIYGVSKQSMETKKIGNISIVKVVELKEKNEISKTALLNIGNTFDMLVEEVANIEGMLEFIKNISAETNLLSLNASIEAAKAGETGRGFAVVAGEVSKLASQTQISTEDIDVVIAKIRDYVNETMNKLEDSKMIFEEQAVVVEKAIESFEKIVKSNDTITEHIEEIGEITEHMSGLKEQSIKATEKILAITEGASANTEEVMSATLEELATSENLAKKSILLQKSVEELRRAIGVFTLRKEEVSDEQK